MQAGQQRVYTTAWPRHWGDNVRSRRACLHLPAVALENKWRIRPCCLLKGESINNRRGSVKRRKYACNMARSSVLEVADAEASNEMDSSRDSCCANFVPCAHLSLHYFLVWITGPVSRSAFLTALANGRHLYRQAP